MKRIGLFLGVSPNGGGMFQYAESLLQALDTFPTDEYRVEVVYVDEAWPRILKRYGFSTTELRAGRMGLRFAEVSMALRIPGGVARVLGYLNPLRAQIKRLRCDLWVFPAQDAISYQLDVPAIGTVHDLMHRYEPHFPEVAAGVRYEVREHRFRNLVCWARAILVDSNVGRDQVVESYGVNPGKIFPLPYVSPIRVADAPSTPDFESRFRVPKKFFFYPSQFWAHKNHRVLLNAIAAVKTRIPNIHIVFTGSGDKEQSKVLSVVKTLGLTENVTITGYLSEGHIVEMYKRARALVMPTFFGPTNIPPLEALSCNCPIAVSRIYGMPEQLGDAALYFDPKSVDEVSQILMKLWMDDALCEELKEKGRARDVAWGLSEFAFRLRTIVDAILDCETLDGGTLLMVRECSVREAVE